MEVVVALLVTVVLAQLAIPLLTTTRESARRRQCSGHLRQIGTALAAYHAAHGSLPPAAVWGSRGLELPRFLKTPRPIEVTYQNWVQCILPWLGEEQLAARFDAAVPVTEPRNEAACTWDLPATACPSDTFRRGDNPYVLELVDGSRAEFARGNYAINGGSHYIYDYPGWLTNPRPNGVRFALDQAKETFQWWGSGVAGINKSFKYDDMLNGLSTMVAVDEVRAGVAAIDPRGVWALGQIGSSITWAHGISGDAYGPNNSVKDSDDIQGCVELHGQLGADGLARLRMPCCDHCTRNDQATSRSMHPGGVNVLMMDGASRFVGDDVDVGLWHVMHSRETPSDVLAEEFDARLAARDLSRIEAQPPAVRQRPSSGAESAGVLSNSIGMAFRLVPPGEFVMGLPNANNRSPYPKEARAHPVRITRSFYLGIHEVTQEQYALVMGENPSWHSASGEGRAEMGGRGTSRHPVENVTWYEAEEFCRRLSQLPAETTAGRSYRLPTEAEWEYACRAGQSEPFEFHAKWSQDDGSGRIAGKDWTPEPLLTVPVGSYSPNPFGFHDMCGNVHEWCADWFGLDYYSRSPVEDPQGPREGYIKVVRGWYWVFTGPACVTNVASVPWHKSQFIGFRVVCDSGSDGDQPSNSL